MLGCCLDIGFMKKLLSAAVNPQRNLAADYDTSRNKLKASTSMSLMQVKNGKPSAKGVKSILASGESRQTIARPNSTMPSRSRQFSSPDGLFGWSVFPFGRAIPRGKAPIAVHSQKSSGNNPFPEPAGRGFVQDKGAMGMQLQRGGRNHTGDRTFNRPRRQSPPCLRRWPARGSGGIQNSTQRPS